MPHAATRSAPVEHTSDRAPVTADIVPITLGVQRLARSRHRGTLRELILSIVAGMEPPAPVEPALAQASSPPATLLLTEADFAPPDAVASILMRVAGFAVLASGCGAAAYLAMSLL
jgi:hypothetical protein